MLVLDEHSNSQTIGAILGQELEIRLQENPTAGFRWRFVQTGEPVCTLLGHRFVPGREVPGQGGVHSWILKAIAEGTTTIKLVYCRSWENVTDAARSFALSLSVKQ